MENIAKNFLELIFFFIPRGNIFGLQLLEGLKAEIVCNQRAGKGFLKCLFLLKEGCKGCKLPNYIYKREILFLRAGRKGGRNSFTIKKINLTVYRINALCFFSRLKTDGPFFSHGLIVKLKRECERENLVFEFSGSKVSLTSPSWCINN